MKNESERFFLSVRYSERCYALWFKGRRRVGMDCSGRMNLRENHPYWAEGYICSKKLREHVIPLKHMSRNKCGMGIEASYFSS
ncbi:hypothetical protein NECAME_19415 [Necator americanus]|uniref:Uncharacterized protein n=1 Tax=Necator americanus TaxID=51031 RepID=W2SPN0_NECAM|nr:hypothetical protein NECAME_19415 [Necator americanus]ETN70657.1 hypothetical protein NECAME_19415 [Necator americanus]